MGMNNTQQIRAAKGGQTGMNGEFYPGGTFLPTTQLGKMAKGDKGGGSRKERVGEYQWEVPPQGMRSIFALFPYHPSFHSQSRERVNPAFVDIAKLDRLYALWIAGEKWVAA